MINSVIGLLMTYFPDHRPVTLAVLNRKCKKEVLTEAIKNNYIVQYDTDSYGEPRFVITSLGKELRDQ